MRYQTWTECKEERYSTVDTRFKMHLLAYLWQIIWLAGGDQKLRLQASNMWTAAFICPERAMNQKQDKENNKNIKTHKNLLQER